MKRFLVILAIALSSCTTDSANSNSSEPAAETDCRCNTILEASVFRLPTGQSFTAGVMENDCSGVQKNFNLNGVYSLGQKICN